MCNACKLPHELHINNSKSLIVTAEPRPSLQTQTYNLIYTCPIEKRQQVYRTDLDPSKLSGEGDPDIMNLKVLPENFTPKPKEWSLNLGIEEEALAEYAKTGIKESENVIKKFITFMVPLTTALITTYLALLEFVGVETLENATASNNQILLPPILMIISLGIFISANFPYIGGIASGNVQSIKKHRSNSLNLKSGLALSGAGLFVIGISFMMLVIIMPLGSDSVENERQDFLTYENPLYNYTIGYPSYWRLDEEGGPQSVIIRVPDEQILDRPRLHIRNEEFSTNSTPKLEQYASQVAHQIGANSSSRTLLSGYPAYEIVWNNSSNFRKELVTIVNNTTYSLSYTSNRLDYDIYLDTIETMISSFRIIPIKTD